MAYNEWRQQDIAQMQFLARAREHTRAAYELERDSKTTRPALLRALSDAEGAIAAAQVQLHAENTPPSCEEMPGGGKFATGEQ